MLVFCNGMLRSGSTLQYNVAAAVLDTQGQLDRVGFVGGFDKTNIRVRLKALRDAPRLAILKTHEAPLPGEFYTDRVRILFSYRDVRDVAASIKKMWGYSFARILDQIDAMLQIEQRLGDLAHLTLIQSYDRLYQDLPRAVREIADFLSVDIDPGLAEGIAAKWAIGSSEQPSARAETVLTRAIGRLPGRATYDAQTLLHRGHISASRGRDGEWTEHFSPDQLKALNGRYGEWLTVHGYAVT